MIKIVLFILFSSLTIVSCYVNKSKPSSNNPNNFENFSKRFFNDSIFQLKYIQFPLIGKLVNDTIKVGNDLILDKRIDYWNLAEWRFLHLSVIPNNVNCDTFISKDTTVINCYIPNSDAIAVLKFVSNGDSTWKLTYYLDTF